MVTSSAIEAAATRATSSLLLLHELGFGNISTPVSATKLYGCATERGLVLPDATPAGAR